MKENSKLWKTIRRFEKANFHTKDPKQESRKYLEKEGEIIRYISYDPKTRKEKFTPAYKLN